MSAAIIFTYNDNSKLYTVKAKWLITLPIWEGNRVIDMAHVDKLAAAINDPTQLQGPYSVVTYKDDAGVQQNRIIDGQHRKEILSRYFATHVEKPDFNILVRRYHIESHDAAIQIFQQINHAKPMIYRGSSTERIHLITEALKQKFVSEKGRQKIALIRTGSVRPFLNVETLIAAIKLYKIHEDTKISPEQIVTHAETMNAFYAEDVNRTGAQFTKTMLERATDYGFYLGLDPKCPWLLGLITSPHPL
jgi:hypothetical protein